MQPRISRMTNNKVDSFFKKIKNTTNSTKAYSSVTFVSAGSLMNAILGFIFLTGVAKALTLSDFGKYAILTSLLTLLSRIMDFGTNSVYVSNENKSKGLVTSKVLLLLIALPISILSLYILGLNQIELNTIFVLGLMAYGINYTMYAYLQKSQDYMNIVLLNGLPALVKGLFGSLLFFEIINVNLTYSFAIFSLSIFASLLVFKSNLYNEIKINFQHLDIKLGLQLIKKSLAAGASQLIYESWQTINNILIKFFNTFSEVGIFSMANKISNIFSLMSVAVFTVLLPKNTERRNILKSGYDFKESTILSAAVLLSSILLIFLAEIFLDKVFGDKFSQSKIVLDLLIVAGAVSAIQNFLENYFFVENETKYLVIINVTKLSLLIILALILIPQFGLYILALSNLAAAIVGLILTFLFIVRLEKIKN